MSAQATPLGATHAIGRPDSAVEQVRAGRGGGSYRGGGAYRGGAAYRGGVAYRGGAGPPIAAGLAYRGGAWARPGRYWWRPGGAIAAGAAIGFVSAATAAAWAGAAPAANMCWYYTDPSQTQSFWDYCM